jgi:hypothetical protein
LNLLKATQQYSRAFLGANLRLWLYGNSLLNELEYRYVAVCNFVKYRNGDVGRESHPTTVLTQLAQRYRIKKLLQTSQSLLA